MNKIDIDVSSLVNSVEFVIFILFSAKLVLGLSPYVGTLSHSPVKKAKAANLATL